MNISKLIILFYIAIIFIIGMAILKIEFGDIKGLTNSSNYNDTIKDCVTIPKECCQFVDKLFSCYMNENCNYTITRCLG